MFKYKTHINGYITGLGIEEFLEDGKTPNPKFDAKKEELRNTDLTDEFREHFTGVLKKHHDENLKQPTKTTPNQFTVGKNTWVFSYEAGTEGERIARETIVEPALERKPTVWVGEDAYDLTPDGKHYEQRGPFYSDEEGTKEIPKKDWPKPIPIMNFIRRFGGSQQPTLISGAGFGGVTSDEELEDQLFGTKVEDMSTEALSTRMRNQTATEEERLEWMRRVGQQF